MLKAISERNAITRSSKNWRLLAVLGASFIGAQIAHAQVDTVETAVQGHACAEDQYKNLNGSGTLNCTANDLVVTASSAINSNTVQSCPIGQQATVSILLSIQSGNTDRYNIGYFVGENGNTPSTAGGTCSVTTFPLTPTGSNATGGKWFDSDGNACGDYDKGSSSVNQVDNVLVLCQADVNGNLVIPFTLVYGNNAGTCTGVNDVTAGTSAKCETGSVPVSNVFVTTDASPSCGNAAIQFVPTDATGGTITKTFTISNNDPNHTQDANGTQFEDNLTLNTPAVTVTNVTCGNVQGGAVCGTMTNNANDVTGTITTFPFGSSVDITITGTVAACPAPGGCTYSNSVDLITPPTVLPPTPPYTRDPATGISTFPAACSAQTTLPVKLQSFDVK